MTGDPTYYKNINTQLLRHVPKNAKNIIEFGCGEANFGKVYKQYNPDCNYMGIEIFEDAAKVAKKNIDNVLVANIDTLTLEEITAYFNINIGSVDCIIYGDVIEHLLDPWKTVKLHTELLTEEGVLTACIPNVSHWSIIHQLLNSNWKYEEFGLLDKTHLRFFSLNTVKDFCEQCNLRSIDIVARTIPDEENHKKFFQAALPLIKAVGANPDQANIMTRAYQYLLIAQKKTAPKAPRIILDSIMLKPVGAVNDLRIIEPFNFLASIPNIQASQQIAKMNLLTPAQPGTPAAQQQRIFVWHRPIMSYKHAIPVLKRIIAHNYLVVVEFDDDIDHWPLAKKENYLTLKGCHAIQTTNEELANLYREHNPEIGVFPNQIAMLPPKPEINTRNKLNIFFGAIGREDDWKPVLPLINKIIKTHGKKLHFHVIHDKDFLEALDTNQKSFTPLCNYEQYQQILKGCDIALLPLEDTRFNRMKSDLKFIECAAHGVATLAPPIVYENTIEHNKTGLIYHSPEEFTQYFNDLIKKKKLRQTLVENAYDYVRNNRLLCQHYMQRYEWYKSLHARRDELHAKLLERVPEIKA